MFWGCFCCVSWSEQERAQCAAGREGIGAGIVQSSLKGAGSDAEH